MTKYNVTNRVYNPIDMEKRGIGNEVRDNYVGDYIEAESEAEAIALAIDYLVEAIRDNGFYPVADYEKQEITVEDSNEDKVVEIYDWFEAKEEN